MKRSTAWMAVALSFAAAAASAEPAQRAMRTRPEVSPALEIALEAGAGLFTGRFADHLARDGAYPITPTFDVSIGIPTGEGWGLQAVLANLAVIHPQSSPIEGTIHQEILEIFYSGSIGTFQVRAFAGIGFQHATLLLQYYSCGVAEIGASIGRPLMRDTQLIVSAKYRISVLPSLLIAEEYGLAAADPIRSVSFCAGIRRSLER